MTILYSGNGTIRFPVAAGNSLKLRNLSGVETVTGSSASREDASTSIGAGFVVYGPQSVDTTITLSTTGQCDYQVVAGDPMPSASTSSGAVGPVVRPVNNTDGALRDALNALKNTYGYGTLDLTGLSIGVDGPITPFSGLQIRGWKGPLSSPRIFESSVSQPGAEIFPTTTTLNTLNNTQTASYNFVEWNAADLANYPSSGGTPTVGDIFPTPNVQLTHFGMEDLFIRGFKNNIKIGALRNGGCFHSNFNNLWLQDAGEWNIHLENFQHLRCAQGIWMVGNGGLGGVQLGSSSGNFNPGNSDFGKIFITKPNTWSARGMHVFARSNAGGNNDLTFAHLQVNGGGNTYRANVAVSFTSGDPWVVVTNPADMAYFFDQSVFAIGSGFAGFADNAVYVVTAIDTPGHRIQCRRFYSDGSNRTPTATGTGTFVIQGMPLLELRAYTSNQQVQPCWFQSMDLENDATALVYMDHAQASLNFGVTTDPRSGGNTTTVVARNGSLGVVNQHMQNSVAIDQDSTCSIKRYGRTIQFSGQGENSRPGIGFTEWVGGTNGTSNEVSDGAMMAQFRQSGEPSLFLSRMSALKVNDCLQLLWSETGAATVDLSSGAGGKIVVSLTGNGQTCTLPQIYPAYVSGNSKTVGYWLVISNATANTQTVNSSASQTFRGGGASSASLSIPAYTTVEVWACSQAGTGYWAWEGASGTGGTSTQSGNAVQTVFTIAHGLGAAPSKFSVTPGSAAAALVFFATTDATNITVTYTAAPATGTNNVVLRWIAAL